MDDDGRDEQRALAVLGAVTTAAWTAVPDWTSTTRQRRSVRAAVAVLGTGAAVAWAVAHRDPQAVDEPDDDADEPPTLDLRTAAPVVAGVATSLALARGSHVLEDRLVAALRRRGVRRPHTWVGVGAGVATLALGPVERRLEGATA